MKEDERKARFFLECINIPPEKSVSSLTVLQLCMILLAIIKR